MFDVEYMILAQTDPGVPANTIAGIRSLSTPHFPFLIPAIRLVIQLRPHRGAPSTVQTHIVITDSYTVEIGRSASENTTIPVETRYQRDCGDYRRLMVTLPPLHVYSPGLYEIALSLNGVEKKRIPLDILLESFGN